MPDQHNKQNQTDPSSPFRGRRGLTLYQIDAFTNKLFGGNPAAVVPLTKWLDDTLMQQLALENNLSETVFFVPSKTTGADFDIRWFTPQIEINLCGHATLASAYVLFEILGHPTNEIVFSSKSGLLKIKKDETSSKEFKAFMDFPSLKPERLDIDTEQISAILGGIEIVAVYQNRDVLVELLNEEAVKNCQPDFGLMKRFTDKMIITAPGKKVDFVSRFFGPGVGVDKDPVTGSAHSQLIPFWSEKLNQKKLHALQLSARGGEIWCEQAGERVLMGGNAVYYMKGEFVV
ncbi:MAG TPA: PhzF family phenazine biosynthesis protein [Ferruginibacter sp.]|nr:PhzF family phenazine biosynthesis protein [Ferruginibacter sp.]